MKISAREAALGFNSPQDQIIRRRLTDEHQLDVLLVSDPLSKLIVLEIQMLPENLRLPDVDVGDILDIELLGESGKLRLKLLSKDYADIFYVLVDDLVNCLISNQGSEVGARALMVRLRRWEHLLEASSRGMTKSAQKGLFGELIVLTHLLSFSNIERRTVLNSWTGPDGGTRDFEIGATGIEVKVSSAGGVLSVRISSERQLEIVAMDDLFLWCISIESSDNGIDLNKKVEEVEKLLSGDQELSDIFKSKLLRVGYLEVDKHRYTSKFFVRGEFIYRISDAFPRIVSESIPNGVFDVSYCVDLEACDIWRVTEQDVKLKF